MSTLTKTANGYDPNYRKASNLKTKIVLGISLLGNENLLE